MVFVWVFLCIYVRGCPSGQFTNVSGSGCSLCSDYTPSQIRGFSRCYECYSNYAQTETDCYCNIGYYDADSTANGMNCQSCHSNCQTCYGPTYENCLTCKNGNLRAVDGICYCLDGYIRTGTTNVNCDGCTTNCLVCCHTNANRCQLCSGSMYQISSGCASSGTPFTNSCPAVVCHSYCSTCYGPAPFQCTACSATGASLSAGSCVCPSKHFFNSGKTACLACDPSCTACTGAGSNECTSCNDPSATLISGACVCPGGANYNVVGDACEGCHPSCSTCSGSGANQCTGGCVGSSTLNGGTCECPSGKAFDASWVCINCHANCATCHGTASNQCDYCLNLNAQINTGTCTCEEGYYETGTGAFQCTQCNSLCKGCSGSSTYCTTCQDANASPVSGVCSCNLKYYNSGTSTAVVCSSCFQNCATCHGTADNQCNTCLSTGAIIVGNKCTCGGGYYQAGVRESQCSLCDGSCLTCSGAGASACQTCRASNASPVSGVCTCDQNFFNSNTSGGLSCTACHTNCSTCHGTATNECDSCKSSHAQIISNTCTCKEGYHESGTGTTQCSQCHLSCKTCSGASSTQCTACVTNAKLTSGACACDQGYFDSDTGTQALVCVACDVSCLTCSGPSSSECLSCSGSTPINGMCVCSGSTYDADPSSLISCQQCNLNCSTCFGGTATSCLTCKDSIATALSGACVCAEGYYDSGDTLVSCSPCHSSCSACNGPTSIQCTACIDTNLVPVQGQGCTCKDGYALDKLTGLCVLSCEIGTYFSGSACQPCYITCIACTESTINCQACVQNASLVGGKCVCSAGYKEAETGCLKAKPNVAVTVNNDNTLELTFSEPYSLTEADLSVAIEGLSGVSFTLEQKSATEWVIVLATDEEIPDGALVNIVFNDPDLGVVTPTSTLTGEAAPRSDDEKQVSAVSNTTTAFVITAVSAVTISGMMTGNMSSAWGLINTIQLLGYIPMMNLDLPIVLSSFFKSILSFSIIPNIFEYFEPDDSQENISAGRRVGMDSSLFLVNTGELFTGFFIGLIYCPICLLFSNLHSPKISAFFQSSLRKFKYSYFLRFIIESHLDFTLAALFQTLFFSLDSLNIIINSAISVVCLALCIGAPVISAKFVYKNYNRFNEEVHFDFNSNWGSLFNEFKNERGFWSCCYYVLFFVRRLLYVCFLGLFNNYPRFQSFLNILHSIMTTGFVIWYQPFKEKLQNIIAIYGEFGITLTFFLVCFYSLDLNSTVRTWIMWAIMGIVYSIMLGHFVISTILSAKCIHQLWKKWRRSRTLL